MDPMLDPRARWTHTVAGLVVVGMAATAVAAPAAYQVVVQEDGPIEWLTFAFFAVAGGLRLPQSIGRRRAFDTLVALFCLFVAGEEISWGQRLLGYTPPEYFLEGNVQQEANLHNFADVFGRPGITLALLLAAYGLLLTLAHATPRLRPWLHRIGATAPVPATVPWFGLTAILLVLYPLEFMGEWLEALAGGLFLVEAVRGGGRRAVMPWLGAVIAAGGLTAFSLYARDPGGRQTACATVEAEALLRDLVSGGAALEPLARTGYVHKRLFTAADDGYVDPSAMVAYIAAPSCRDESNHRTAVRRRYGVDPWGMSYWLVSDGRQETRRVAVYSMGPNRRREGQDGRAAGDDVVVYSEF